MPHTPTPFDVIVLFGWGIGLFYIGRRFLCWFFRTRRIEQRQIELEVILRAIAAKVGAEVPPAKVELTAREQLRTKVAALRAAIRKLCGARRAP